MLAAADAVTPLASRLASPGGSPGASPLASPGASPGAAALALHRKLVTAAVVAFAALEAAYLLRWLEGPQEPPFDDFFGLWSFGKFATEAGAAIYHPSALQAFQHALDPSFGDSYPYPYPPTLLLALAPLGLLPLALAYALWICGTFGLYALATLGREWRSRYGVALLVAPTTLLTIVSGQNGLLSAALLVGGLRCLKPSPLAGGILLGLLAYKPQFGLVVPIVLIASRQWRAMFAACLTVMAAIAASSAAFGWSIWLDWLRTMPLYWHLLKANQAGLSHLMPTVMAGMMQLGASAQMAYAGQVVVAAALAITVWRLVARALDERAIAAAIVATALASPYAFTYDMPMIAAALVIAARMRRRCDIPLHAWEIAVVLLLFACLIGMTGQALPLAAPVLMLITFVTIAMTKEDRTADERGSGTALHR